VNNKDRIFARNELIAWGHWQREGCTLQNALGFVVGSLEGNVNDVQISPIVPTRFNIDKNVDIVLTAVFKNFLPFIDVNHPVFFILLIQSASKKLPDNHIYSNVRNGTIKAVIGL